MIELTVKNFEEKINEVVEFIRKNPPSTREEFKQYTKAFYGVEIDCEAFVYPVSTNLSVSYLVVQRERDNAKCELYRMWDKKFGKYDGLRVLLDATFGELACGGVAHSHYGQTKGLSEERRKILKNWDNTPNSDKVIKDYIQTQHELNKIFGS